MKKINYLSIVLIFAVCISDCTPMNSASYATETNSQPQSASKAASSSNSSNENASINDAEFFAKFYASMFLDTELNSPNDIMEHSKFNYLLLCSSYVYFHRYDLLEEQKDENDYIHAKLTWDDITWIADNLFGIENLTEEIYRASNPDYYKNAYQDGYIDYIPLEIFDFEYDHSEIKSMNVSDNIYTFELEILCAEELGGELSSKGRYLYKLEKLSNGAFRLISVKAS